MAEDKNSKVTQNQDRINKLIDGLTLLPVTVLCNAYYQGLSDESPA